MEWFDIHVGGGVIEDVISSGLEKIIMTFLQDPSTESEQLPVTEWSVCGLQKPNKEQDFSTGKSSIINFTWMFG